MNAPVEIQLSPGDVFRHATDDANRWRGRMVNLFARGELIIAKALQSAHEAKPLPMLLSQRINQLASLVHDDEKKAKTLKSFSELAQHRNCIVHGSGTIYLDRESRWLLALEAIDRSGTIKTAIGQADAQRQDGELKTAVDRLSAAFRA